MVTGIVATDGGEPIGSVGKLMSETDTHISELLVGPHADGTGTVSLGLSDGTRLIASLEHRELMSILVAGLARGVVVAKVSADRRN